MDKGFVSNIYEASVEFNKISYELFETYRDLLGTDVTIIRHKEGTKRKNTLSITYTNTFEDSDDTERFRWKLIINKSSMYSKFRRNTDSVDVYEVKDILRSGDVVEFEYLGLMYQFKVTATQSYGMDKDIVYQYTLSPIIEHRV